MQRKDRKRPIVFDPWIHAGMGMPSRMENLEGLFNGGLLHCTLVGLDCKAQRGVLTIEPDIVIERRE